MTPTRFIQGLDVDTYRLAGALRRLADGIESHDVAITATSTTNDVPDTDDLAEFGFSVRYHTTHEYEDVVDMVRYATKAYIRFADRYIGDILTGDKTITVRYGFERSFNPGDDLALIDEDGDIFAESSIEAIVEMPIYRVCEFGIGEWSEDDVDDLVDTLRDLYAHEYTDVDDRINAGTYVTVVLFGTADPRDDYPTEQYL